MKKLKCWNNTKCYLNAIPIKGDLCLDESCKRDLFLFFFFFV